MTNDVCLPANRARVTSSSKKLVLGLIAQEDWRGGIVYTHNLVRALAALPAEERPRIVLICRREADLFRGLEPLVDRFVLVKPSPVIALSNTRVAGAARILKGLASALLFRQTEPEVAAAIRDIPVDAMFPVNSPYTRGFAAAIAWIPDLQHRAEPHLFRRFDRLNRDHRYRRLLRDPGRHVVFSSMHALQDAVANYGVSGARCHVLHFATTPEVSWFGQPGEVLARFGLQEPYFIVCNQFWAHKEHRTVVRAVQCLARKNVKANVVCTGPTEDYRHPGFFSSFMAEVTDLGLQDRIRVLGLIPRADQIPLIRGALAVLQPSRFEGWSTVLEDARAVGQRVIASDFPVHLEQDVCGARYFTVSDPEDCARAMLEVLRAPGPGADALQRDALQRDALKCYDRQVNEVVPAFARRFLQIVREATAT